jgi:predicted ArsR family transcriptional regulator
MDGGSEVNTMLKENDKKQEKNISLTRAFSSDLKSRQSVRATFRLTKGCIVAISIVANQMGIKQKSLFDHMAEDLESLTSIAREVKQTKIKKQGRIQKTFVISRKSLSSLDEISDRFNASRDELVEYSIQRLLPLISKERTKHKIRKEFLLKIKTHLQQGKKMLTDIRKQLGDDDPIINKFAMVMSSYETVKDQMESFIDRSKVIETFDTDNITPY